MNPSFLPAAVPPFELRAFLHRYLWRYRYGFVLSLTLAFAAAALYLRYANPVYEVRATLLIKTPQGSSNGLSEEVILQDLGMGQRTKNLENEMQVLRSHTLMEAVIRDLDLHLSYFSEGRVRRRELYLHAPIQLDSFQLTGQAYGKTVVINDLPRKNGFRWREGSRSWTGTYGRWLTTPSGAFRLRKLQKEPLAFENLLLRIQDPQDVAQAYADRLQIEILGGFSSVLKLRLRDPVPEKGKAVLNGLVEAYNRVSVADKNRVGRNTLAFIDERLELISAELAGVEKKVEAYKRWHDMPLDATAEVNLRLAERAAYEEERKQLQTRNQLVESLIAYLQEPENEYALIPLQEISGKDPLGELILTYNLSLLERERRNRSARGDNPALAVWNARLAKERQNILKSLEARRLQYAEKLALLAGEQRENVAQIRSIPRQERELLEIQRQQQIKANLFLYLLEKREETALSLAAATPNSRLIDPARIPKKPVLPNPDLLYALAGFLGIVLPAAVILLIELLNDRLQSEYDIRQITAAPILGKIGRPSGRQKLIAQSDSDMPVAEMFRLLRTNLYFQLPGADAAVVLICSVMSGEGKTFVAANLAATLALDGKKTVAVELDLRKPQLEQYLQEEQPAGEGPGLSHFLSGQASPEDILRCHAREHLFYIPSGPTPPNPAELINRPPMKELISDLRKRFDFVLLDTPPLGLVTDGLLLSTQIDASLFIVRFGHTRRQALLVLEELLQTKTFPRPGLVTNGQQVGPGYGYLNAYRKRYGKREGPKPKLWSWA